MATDWITAYSAPVRQGGAVTGWRLTIRDAADREYEVTLLYVRGRDRAPLTALHGTVLGRHELELAGNTALLELRRDILGSAEAIADPPLRHRYTLSVCVAERLLVARTLDYSVPSSRRASDPPAEEDRFITDPELAALRHALQRGQHGSIARTPIVDVTRRLLEQDGPLAEELAREVVLEVLRFRAGSAAGELEVVPGARPGTPVYNLAATTGHAITLFPRFKLVSHMPLLHAVRTTSEPLPPFAVCALRNEDYTLRLAGTPTGAPGEFRLGPFRPTSLLQLHLEGHYPLLPDQQADPASALLRFRNGRPVERFLDRGEWPTPPPLKASFGQSDVISRVLHEVALRLNPDTGRLDGSVHLDDRRLLVLSYLSPEETSIHGELERHLRAVRVRASESARIGALAAAGPLRTDGWTAGAAFQVLEHPPRAREFAAVAREHPEPLDEPSLFMGKEEPLVAPLAAAYCVPHVVAAAALADSRDDAHSDVIHTQLESFERELEATGVASLSLDDLVAAGQCLKLISARSPNALAAPRCRALLSAVRNEALRRYTSDRKLRLTQKIDIAHLLSDIWYPYLCSGADSPGAVAEGPPQQRFSLQPGGPDLSNAVLEGVLTAYRAALARALHELGSTSARSDRSPAWFERFFDAWSDRLRGATKGGGFEPVREELERDRLRVRRNQGSA